MSEFSITVPKTNTGTTSTGSQGTGSQYPSEKTYTVNPETYTYRGKEYKTKEEALNALNNYNASVHADFVSVGSDINKYNALIASGQGISQMGDNELDFIKNRYAQSDISKRKAYTNSYTDQYLASQGLPSSKELSSYRQKYIDYMGNGGMEQYSQLLEKQGDNYYFTDAAQWIQKQWEKDNAVGLNDETVTQKGKDIKYEDTLLDEQLKEQGLPPSAQLNEYFLKYKKDLEINDEIEQFNSEVFDLVHSEKQVPVEDAFYEVLEKHSNLIPYLSEEIALPSEDDDKYKDTLFQFKSEEYQKDRIKAFEAMAKRDQMEHRISVSDYKKYDYDKNTERMVQRDTEIYTKAKERYDQWFTKGAITPKEKEQRAKDVSDFLNFNGYVENTYNGGNVKSLTAEDVNQIVQIEPSFRLLDNGVPSDLVQKLYADSGSYNAATLEKIRNWNDKENLYNPKKHAEVEASLLYTGLEGSYEETVDTMSTTWRVQNSKSFDKRNKYNADVYVSQIGENGVSEGGALYSLVAGQQVDNRAVNRSAVNVVKTADNRAYIGDTDEDSGIAYSFYSSVDNNGKRMSEYLTDDEKAVYFYLSSFDIKEGSKYLNELQGVASKRSYMNSVGGDYGKILSGTATTEEFLNYEFNTKLYEKGEELRGLKEGRTDYWKREAWDEYSAMSDAALKRRRDEIESEAIAAMASEPVSSQENVNAVQVRMYYGTPEIEGAYNNELKKIDFVIQTREELKRNATITADLKDYTDAKGNAATARVSESPNYMDSQYAELINRTEAEMRRDAVDAEGMIDAVEANRQLKLGGKRDANVLRSLSQEQKSKFNYLLVNYSAEVADAYIDSIYNAVDTKAAQERNQQIAGWASKNFGTQAGATALSVLVPPATSGAFALVGALGNALTGKETSKLQATTWDFSNEWREAVPTGDIFRWLGMSDEDAQKWGQIGYGAVMSMVDSTGAAFLNMLGGEVGTAALASSAFSSSLRNGLMRGLDAGDATTLAFVSGVAEYVTEKVGLETIMDTVSSFKNSSFGAGKTVQNLLIRALKPTLTEASEEALSNIATTIADGLINGDMSEYNEEYNRYIDQGYSKEEAKKLATNSWIGGLWTDAAIGGITGFLMSAGGMASGIRLDTTYNRMVDAGIDPTTGKRSYDTPNNPNGKFGATKPVANPVVSARAQSYTNGRTTVERVFNKKVADKVQTALDNNFIEDERVANFEGQLQRADNTDFVYRAVGADNDGNIALTDDERTALAVALAATGEDDLDVAYTMLKVQEQTPKQRLANADTSFKSILSVSQVATDLKKINENRKKISDRIATLNKNYGNVSDELRGSYARSMADLQHAITLFESGDMKGAITALNALSSKQATNVNKEGAVNNFDSELSSAVSFIASNNDEIRLAQERLDRHFATLANALDYFSLNYGSQKATAMQAQRVKRMREQIGAKKDAVLLNNSLDEQAKQKAYDELSKQEQDLASIGGYLSRYANMRGGRSKFDIMLKVKNGTFQDFVAQSNKEQEQATPVVPATQPTQEVKAEQPPQNAVSEASPANTETTSEQPASTAETGSEAVKQENTTQEQAEEKETPKMREVKINKNWQKRIVAVARRFGLKVVFGEVFDEDGQPTNGKYDPSEPDTVYLNTTLRTDLDRSNEQVIALELLRHEVVHWVRATSAEKPQAYESLKEMAMLYLAEQNADVQSVIDEILADNPSYKGNQELGEEEMTAMFVQTVLFGGEDGSRRAMKWMAQSSRRNVFDSMRKYNDYLIARSEIRNARDGDAIKLLLLDAEMEFTRAIEERQILGGNTNVVGRQEEPADNGSVASEQPSKAQAPDEAKQAEQQSPTQTEQAQATQTQEQEPVQAQTEAPASVQEEQQQEEQPVATQEQSAQETVQEQPASVQEETAPVQQAEEQPAQAQQEITFTNEQKNRFSRIANDLVSGKRYAVYIGNAENFESVAEKVKQEILKYVPAQRRRIVRVSTEVNPSRFDSLYILDSSTEAANRSDFASGGILTTTINVGQQSSQNSVLEQVRARQEAQRQQREAERRANQEQAERERSQAREQQIAEMAERQRAMQQRQAEAQAQEQQAGDTRYSRTGKSLSAYVNGNKLGAGANQLYTFADIQRIASHESPRYSRTGKSLSDYMGNKKRRQYKGLVGKELSKFISNHMKGLSDKDRGNRNVSEFSNEKMQLIYSVFNREELETLLRAAQRIEAQILDNKSEENKDYDYIKKHVDNALNQDWAEEVGARPISMLLRSDIDGVAYAVENKLNEVGGGIQLEDVISVVLANSFKQMNKFVGHSSKRSELPTLRTFGRKDNRVYAPQIRIVTKQTWDSANRPISSAVSKAEKDSILSARKDVVFASYYSDVEKTFGIKKKELLQAVEKWSVVEDDSDSPLFELPPPNRRTSTDDDRDKPIRYRESKVSAVQKSRNINRYNTAQENRFSGFENVSILSRANVSDSDIGNLVKKITGQSITNDAEQYERNYVANVMLTLDTHIDWSELSINFVDVVPAEVDKDVLGKYSPSTHEIYISEKGSEETVAHEMGHALDRLFSSYFIGFGESENLYLSQIKSQEEFDELVSKNHENASSEQKERYSRFYHNFTSFIDGLMLSAKTENEDDYYRNRKEVFARFVSDFVYYVNRLSMHGDIYEGEFNEKQYDEFITLLKEKSAIDTVDDSYSEFNSAPARRTQNEQQSDFEFSPEDFEIPTAEDYLAELEAQYYAGNHTMYSNGHSLDYYINRYGAKKQSPYARANNIRTPNQTSKSNRVSDSVQTLKQVPYVLQNLRGIIDDGILEEGLGVYEPKTLDDLREQGMQYITEHGGVTQAMRDLTATMRDVKARDLSKVISAANQVFATISSEGMVDAQEYADFVAEYVMMRSAWGRAGRTMQLVYDTPLGRRTYWERVVQRMNEQNREAVSRGLNPLFYRSGYQDIQIPQDMYDKLQNAQTQEEIEEAEEAITRYIGENSPLTVSEAMRNWRYFSMLFNPVTHMRNMLGNITMQGGRIVKDTIATGIENLAVKAGWMNDNQRTHSIILRQGSASRQSLESLYQEHKGAISSGGRDGFRQTLNDAKRKSPSKLINRLMNFNSNMLENEDELFLHMTFMNAAAQFAAARGIDVTKMSKSERADLVQYATQQAQEATYRDASKLADALNEFSRSGWIQKMIVEGVMPFKKTPINITKRGISYSPFGLAKGITDLARNVASKSRGGELVVSAHRVVDEIAQGLTGSMLSAIGFFLARCGILKLKAGKDDRDDTFERDTGRQSYSLEVGDLSIKIESLAPLTFPLFMGASLYELTSKEGNGFSVSDITDAALSVADPLMDMSFMSSLNEALDTYSENGVMGVASNIAWSYASQYLPTLGSKVNNFVNESFTERRTSKSSAASPVGGTWDYRFRSAASKVPVANQVWLEPYVSTTGEYQKSDYFGEYVTSFLNNFVSPVNVQVIDATPVNDEIHRLVRATGNTDFVPQNPTKYFNIGNERRNLTAPEYTEYSKDHNETVYAILTQIINTDQYQKLTDEQRVDVLSRAYNSAHSSVQKKYQGIYAQKDKK